MTLASGNLSFARRATASLASGLAVAAIAHGVTVLAFFIAAGADSRILAQISNYFLVSTLLAFILLAVLAAVDGYRRWYIAVPGTLLAGILATALGTAFTPALAGSTIDASAVGRLFGSLLGPNLVFIIAVTVAASTLGRRVWVALAAGVDRSTGQGRVALVRVPADNLADGLVTQIERSAVDTDLADEQWDGYVSALIDNGWETVEVPTASELADSVFIEDAVVLFGGTAVVTSPGAESRRGETAAAEATVRGLGLRVTRIELPGTLDGGDVLKVGTTVYVGRGGRTNAEGIRQLRALVSPLGYSVVAVPVTKVLHLKSAVTALPDGTVIGYPPLVDDPDIFDRFLGVPEAEGSAVVVLDHDAVLMSSAAPKSAALIADLGYRVVTVDISEFEKLEGCVTCLSVRVR